MNIIYNLIGPSIAYLFLVIYKEKALKNITDNSILSLYFHNPQPKIFEKCIVWLKTLGFSFISMGKLEATLKENNKIKGKNAFISFDDGWKETLDIMPLLEKYNIPITIFIPTEPLISGNFWWEFITSIKNSSLLKRKLLKKNKSILNYERVKNINKLRHLISLSRSALTLDELVKLSKHELITIGSHSVNHPITTNCTDEELKLEYKYSKEFLENKLGKEIHSFAFPNGNYDQRDINYLKKYGYRLAFTNENNMIFNTSDHYTLPRYNVNDGGSMLVNKAKMLGLWQYYLPRWSRMNF